MWLVCMIFSEINNLSPSHSEVNFEQRAFSSEVAFSDVLAVLRLSKYLTGNNSDITNAMTLLTRSTYASERVYSDGQL